jgi:hypothetical protein
VRKCECRGSSGSPSLEGAPSCRHRLIEGANAISESYCKTCDYEAGLRIELRRSLNKSRRARSLSAALRRGPAALVYTQLAMVACGSLFASVAAAQIPQTYYVSASGNDSNPGTAPSSPWQTIAKVNAGHYNAGDSILFEGGRIFSGSLSFTASSWSGATKAHPIMIGSYGTVRATINSGAAGGFLAHNVAGFVLKDLNFVGAGPSTISNGVTVLNDLFGNVKLDYVFLQHLDVSGYGLSGVVVDGENGSSGFTNVTLSYVTAHDNTGSTTTGGTSGILVASWENYGAGSANAANRNVLIDHCVAYSNPGWAAARYWSGAGITMYNVDRGTIQYSVSANNGVSSVDTVGIWAFDSTNITIQFSESYGTRTNNNADGDGFDLDGGTTNSVMQYNYSHDNDGAGYLIDAYAEPGEAAPISGSSNLTARYNISQNDARMTNGRYGGVALASDTATSMLTNVDVNNNTIYQSSESQANGITIGGPGTATTQAHIANNIFHVPSGLFIATPYSRASPGVSFTGNNYCSTGSFSVNWGSNTYTSMAAWQAVGQERVLRQPRWHDGKRAAHEPRKRRNNKWLRSDHLAGYKNLSGSPIHPQGPRFECFASNKRPIP